jgi:hypothetical protein
VVRLHDGVQLTAGKRRRAQPSRRLRNVTE